MSFFCISDRNNQNTPDMYININQIISDKNYLLKIIFKLIGLHLDGTQARAISNLRKTGMSRDKAAEVFGIGTATITRMNKRVREAENYEK